MTAPQHRYAPLATEPDDVVGAMLALLALIAVLVVLAAPALGG